MTLRVSAAAELALLPQDGEGLLRPRRAPLASSTPTELSLCTEANGAPSNITYVHGDPLVSNAPGAAGDAARAWWATIDGLGTVMVGWPFAFGTMAALQGWQAASPWHVGAGLLLSAAPQLSLGVGWSQTAASGVKNHPIVFLGLLLVVMVRLLLYEPPPLWLLQYFVASHRHLVFLWGSGAIEAPQPTCTRVRCWPLHSFIQS